MAAIRDAYEASGRSVIGLAPTNAVAQDMHRDGFRHAGTVHSELFALNNGRRQWDGRTVVMVDEAAMIDTKLMAELTQHARAAGAKLILVGDDRQLASIDRGGMFGALKDRYGAAALTEVTRQHKDEERRAATMMAEGNFSDALAIYQDKGAIHWTRTQDQARAGSGRSSGRRTARPRRANRVSCLPTRTLDVAQLNADLRAVRRQRGELGEDHELPTADGRAGLRHRRSASVHRHRQEARALQRRGRHCDRDRRDPAHRAARRPTRGDAEPSMPPASRASATAMPARSTEGRGARSIRPISITPSTGVRPRAMSR